MIRPQSANSLEATWRLWYHELWRVFGDRLIEDSDREWFEKNAQTIVNRVGGILNDDVIKNGVVFSDILKIDSPTILYEEVTDLKKVVKVL